MRSRSPTSTCSAVCPPVITIYLVGFGISLTGLPVLKDLSPETFAIIALTLTSSAYVAGVYRAGIDSIHWSQTAASRSLGLRRMDRPCVSS